MQAALTYLSLSAGDTDQSPPADDAHWHNVLVRSLSSLFYCHQ